GRRARESLSQQKLATRVDATVTLRSRWPEYAVAIGFVDLPVLSVRAIPTTLTRTTRGSALTAQNLPRQRGIETGQSWIVAGTALLILSIAYGASLVTVVALQPIAADFGTQRAGPALAVSLTYIGSGLGGIAMGWLAGWFGMRLIATGCGLMMAL